MAPKRVSPRRLLVGTAAASAFLASTWAYALDPVAASAGATAAAAEPTTSGNQVRGLGSSDAFVFSVENVLGINSMTVGSGDSDHDTSVDSLGVLPVVYWGDIGLFKVQDNGLTYGAVLGFEHLFIKDGDDITLIRVRPRIGYAASLNKTPRLGCWLRGGPSWMGLFQENQSAQLLALSFEAYVVVKATQHVGFLGGPQADIHMIGRDDDGNKIKYQSFGMALGLFGEF